jgi:hypothetical protein
MSIGDRPFTEALRDELVRAAERQASGATPKKRRAVPRSLVLAAAALVLAVLASALLLSSPKAAKADVRIEQRDGRIIVTLVDLEHRPGFIEKAVREAGLDITVKALPVGPSRVGRFLFEADATGDAPDLQTIDQQGSSFVGFSVPVGWTGHLKLYVGRPPAAGEAYGAFSDALAPGEPLACLDLVGKPASAVAKAVDGRDLDVTFVVSREGQGVVRLPLSKVETSAYADWVVVRLTALSPKRISVDVAAELPPILPTANSPTC